MDTIRMEVTAKRTTVKAIAAAADVSYVAMRRYLDYEKTGRVMDLSQLFRVADALEVTVEYLTAEAARRMAETAKRVVTQSDTTSSHPQSQDAFAEQAKAAVRAIGEPDRVKNSKRSG